MHNSQQSKPHFISYEYKVPASESNIQESIIRNKSITELSKIEQRIKISEQKYNAIRKKELQNELAMQKKKIDKEAVDFISAVNTSIDQLNQNIDKLLTEIQQYSIDIVHTAFRRLYIDVSNDAKTISVVSEIVNSYKHEAHAELHVPRGFSFSQQYQELLKNWKINYDPKVPPGSCKLNLVYGEISLEFSDSVEKLLDCIKEQ